MQEVGTIEGVAAAWNSNYYLSQNTVALCSFVHYTSTLVANNF
jgi:hypothetical protein